MSFDLKYKRLLLNGSFFQVTVTPMLNMTTDTHMVDTDMLTKVVAAVAVMVTRTAEETANVK